MPQAMPELVGALSEPGWKAGLRAEGLKGLRVYGFVWG